jgi:diacylglycerol kinase family enzyme
MIRKAGHKPRLRSSKEKQWKKALRKPCDIVAVAGGDGTVGKVARNLIGSRTPIALLPLGTANNVARALGIADMSVRDLVEGWQHARCINFDAGVARGPWGSKVFIEGIGVGMFAETMFHIDNGRYSHVAQAENPDAEIKNTLKLLKKQTTHYAPKQLTVRFDGQSLSGDYYLLEILNIRSIGPGLNLAPRAEINDGFFDVVFIAKGEQAQLNRYIADQLVAKPSEVTLTTRRARHLQIECGGVLFHIDDMPWPEDSSRFRLSSQAIDIRAEPGALVFLTPSS